MINVLFRVVLNWADYQYLITELNYARLQQLPQYLK